MEWSTWLGIYACLALVGGIVGTNIISAIREEARLTREAIEALRDVLSER